MKLLDFPNHGWTGNTKCFFSLPGRLVYARGICDQLAVQGIGAVAAFKSTISSLFHQACLSI